MSIEAFQMVSLSKVAPSCLVFRWRPREEARVDLRRTIHTLQPSLEKGPWAYICGFNHCGVGGLSAEDHLIEQCGGRN